MKLAEVLPHFGGCKVNVARALGVTKQAVSEWGDDVPELRQYQIRELLSRRSGASKAKTSPSVGAANAAG